MSDFDRIFTLVQEMNRNWDRSVHAVRTRQYRPVVREATADIVDATTEAVYGQVVVDSRGVVVAVRLDPAQVPGVYEDHLVAAVVTAINAATDEARARKHRIGGIE